MITRLDDLTLIPREKKRIQLTLRLTNVIIPSAPKSTDAGQKQNSSASSSNNFQN